MRIQLVGPMTGYPGYNYQAFHDAAARIRSKGYECFNPAETDTDTSLPRSHFMRAAIGALFQADMIVLLPGSEGAAVEMAVAEQFALPMMTFDVFE
jgi:hypothetical protein